MKENKKMDTIELDSNVLEVISAVEKIRFLIDELDEYDYTYEVDPHKAIQYARNETKTPDAELSFKFCNNHKRIMKIKHIMSDYVYEAEQKLNQIQNSI